MKKLLEYQTRLVSVINQLPLNEIMQLADALRNAWREGRQVFLCGNGGSAANAIHIANDLFYGIARAPEKKGMRVHALTGNQSIMTCLANDVSYSDIFSEQLRVLAQPGDLLVALSGSGNSPNIVKALEMAQSIGMTTFAILGYSGGRCLTLAGTSIYIAIDDMQISEDVQLIVGHIIMQELEAHPPAIKES